MSTPGAYVAADANVVGLETDKATFDVPAPVGGVISRVLKEAGETAEVGEVIGYLKKTDKPASDSAPSPAVPQPNLPEKTQRVMPAAERLMEENDLAAGSVQGSGPGGRVLKEDVSRHLKTGGTRTARNQNRPDQPDSTDNRFTPCRAQQTAALLTTFNEIDMSSVKKLRSQYREAFEKKYGLKLGFMSFFVKAVVERSAGISAD